MRTTRARRKSAKGPSSGYPCTRVLATGRKHSSDLLNYSRGFDPIGAEQLCLLQNGLRGFFLFVGWITVFAEDAVDEDADLGLGGLAQGPVNGHALADVRNQLASNILQGWFGVSVKVMSDAVAAPPQNQPKLFNADWILAIFLG